MCGISGLFDTQGLRQFDRATGHAASTTSRPTADPMKTASTWSPAWRWGTGACRSSTWPPGSSPCSTKTAAWASSSTARSTTSSELVPELQALGHVFKTRSDTEVIVHAWLKPGAQSACTGCAACSPLRCGTAQQQTLFLARDRMGVKPMHYAWLPDGSFIFGSELKVLTAHPGFVRDHRPAGRRGIFSPSAMYPIRAAFTATPAQAAAGPHPHHCAGAWTGAAGRPSPTGTCTSPATTPWALADAEAEVRERVRESVRLRMIADVPLGAFPVGRGRFQRRGGHHGRSQQHAGAHLRHRLRRSRVQRVGSSPSRWPTVTTPTTDLEIVSGDDFDLIDTLAWLYDEPFADSSAMPTYRVCQMARKHVTVALSRRWGR